MRHCYKCHQYQIFDQFSDALYHPAQVNRALNGWLVETMIWMMMRTVLHYILVIPSSIAHLCRWTMHLHLHRDHRMHHFVTYYCCRPQSLIGLMTILLNLYSVTPIYKIVQWNGKEDCCCANYTKRLVMSIENPINFDGCCKILFFWINYDTMYIWREKEIDKGFTKKMLRFFLNPFNWTHCNVSLCEWNFLFKL